MTKNIATDLWNIINDSSEYSFKNDPLPVFYVLYANYCRVGLFNKLDSVGGLLSNAIFTEDDNRRYVYDRLKERTQESLEVHKKLFMSFDQYINNRYHITKVSIGNYDYNRYAYDFKEYIEFFVNEYISLSDNLYEATDCAGYRKIISTLLCTLTQERYIYDYFSGVSSLGLENDNSYVDGWQGYEPDEVLYLISQVRLIAHNISLDRLFEDEPIDGSPVFYSFPYFDPEKTEKALDEFFFEKYSQGIFTLPMEFCYSAEYFYYRYEISERNLLETIIYLPKGTFAGYDKESIILCLSAWGADCDCKYYPEYFSQYFTVVDGRKLLRNGKADFYAIDDVIWGEVVDYERSKDPRVSPHPHVWRNVPVNDETRELWKSNLLPSFWINYMDRQDSPELYEEFNIRDVCEEAKPLEGSESTGAIVLVEDNFTDIAACDLCAPMPLKVSDKIPEGYVAYKGKSLVLRMNDGERRFCIVNEEKLFYASKESEVLSLKDGVAIDWEYFCVNFLMKYHGLTSPAWSKEKMKKLLEEIAKENEIDDVDIDKCASVILTIYLYKSISQQSDFMQLLRAEYQALKDQAEEDRKREQQKKTSSDIAHMLGLSFNAIVSSAKALEDISEAAKKKVDCIMANIDYMQRVLRVVGEDFDSYRPIFNEVRINDMLQSYIVSYRKLNRAVFDIELNSLLSEDMIVSLDEEIFRIMMDAILENARRHGFNKNDKEENLVRVNTSLDSTGKRLIIKFINNGQSLPEDFTLQKFITRGEVMGQTGNSGVGGYHIDRIVRLHKGSLRVYSDDYAYTVVEIQIPIV